MRLVILLLLAGVFAAATLMTAWWAVPASTVLGESEAVPHDRGDGRAAARG